jgi:hypothetical protein
VIGISEGIVLANRYRLVRRQFERGIGAGWVAVDTETSAEVWVQFTRHGGLEAVGELLRRHGHAGMPAVLDTGELRMIVDSSALAVRTEGDSHATHVEIVIEFVVCRPITGRPMAAKVARKPLTPAEALTAVAGLAEALELAVQEGYSHGWLTGESVWLTRRGACALDLALGLCAADDLVIDVEQEVTGCFAPERLAGGPATEAADVFSLGWLLYVLLIGYAALQIEYARVVAEAGAATTVELIAMWRKRARRHIIELLGADSALAALLVAALAEKAQDRPLLSAFHPGAREAARGLAGVAALVIPLPGAHSRTLGAAGAAAAGAAAGLAVGLGAQELLASEAGSAGAAGAGASAAGGAAAGAAGAGGAVAASEMLAGSGAGGAAGAGAGGAEGAGAGAGTESGSLAGAGASGAGAAGAGAGAGTIGLAALAGAGAGAALGAEAAGAGAGAGSGAAGAGSGAGTGAAGAGSGAAGAAGTAGAGAGAASSGAGTGAGAAGAGSAGVGAAGTGSAGAGSAGVGAAGAAGAAGAGSAGYAEASFGQTGLVGSESAQSESAEAASASHWRRKVLVSTAASTVGALVVGVMLGYLWGHGNTRTITTLVAATPATVVVTVTVSGSGQAIASSTPSGGASVSASASASSASGSGTQAAATPGATSSAAVSSGLITYPTPTTETAAFGQLTQSVSSAKSSGQITASTQSSLLTAISSTKSESRGSAAWWNKVHALSNLIQSGQQQGAIPTTLASQLTGIMNYFYSGGGS